MARSKWKAQQLEASRVALYVDSRWGGTPPAPSDDVLRAGLPPEAPSTPAPPPVNPAPVPVRAAPKGHLVVLEPGQTVVSCRQQEQQRARADACGEQRQEATKLMSRLFAEAM